MRTQLHVAKREPLVIDPRALLALEPIRGHEAVSFEQLKKLGFMAGVSGGARGLSIAGDIVTQTADGRDLNEIWAEYQAALAQYNSERDALQAVMTFDVTQVIEDVYQGGEVVDFEEASELGVPRSIRAAPPTYFSLAYTFKWYDIGVGFSWLFLADATTEQVDSLNNAVLEADNRLIFNQIMKAIFNNVTRLATIRGNNYNVYPLYNGDTTIPPKYKQTVHTSGHTHFLTSGAALVDSGDLTGVGSMEAHLKHHGYGWQEGSAMILLVNSAQMSTIRTFVKGVAGAEFDFISSAGIPAWGLSDADLAAAVGAAPPASWNGLVVQGRYGPWLIIEDDLIPAGYMFGFASGGNFNINNLVGFRQHANAGLRGLRLLRGRDSEYPLNDSYYQRGFGTGIRQRGGGVVMQVTAGAYAIPAAYV
jgi:hypothetical protein